MALTLTKEPPAIALNGNDLVYEIQTNNYITQSGDKSYLRLLFSGDIPIADSQIRIYSIDFDLTFTFVETPDNSGLQLSNNFLSVEAMAEVMANALGLNYYINKFCEVEYVYGEDEISRIHITYRDIGKNDLSWQNISAAGIVQSGQYNGLDIATRDSYKIHIVDSAGNEMMKIPDTNNKVVFNFKQLIELAGGFKWPETEHEALLHENFVQSFIVKYFDKWEGTDPQLLYSVAKTVVMGAISRKSLAYLAENATNWYDFITANKKFLTWAPAYKIIDSSATVKLYFFVTEKITGMQARIRINNDDEQISSLSVLSVSDGAVYEVIVSPRLLFNENDIIDVWKYDVWLIKQNGDTISEVKEFYLDWFYHEFRREFLFSNSYEGAYDSFVFYGKSEETTELSNYLYEHRVFDTDLSGIKQSRTLLHDTFKATTGYLNKETLYYLDELLHSSDRYEIIGGRLYPIYITGSKIFRRRDGEDLYKLQIEYARSFKEEYYDNILPSSGIPYVAGATALPSGGGGGGGHIIVDSAGSIKPQRKYLKFTASGIATVTVTDDMPGDTTIVNIDATQAEVETSAWKNINLQHIDTTPLSALSIQTTIDLRSVVGAGDVVKVKVGGAYKYGYVFSVSNQVITFRGEEISGTIQELRIGYTPAVGGWYMVPEVVAYGSWADADESTMIANDIRSQLNLGVDNLKVLCIKAFCREIDTGVPNAQAKLVVKADGNNLNTALEIASANTWYYSTEINTSNNELNRVSVIEYAVTAATGALALKNTKDLSVQCFVVKTNIP